MIRPDARAAASSESRVASRRARRAVPSATDFAAGARGAPVVAAKCHAWASGTRPAIPGCREVAMRASETLPPTA